MTENKVAIVTGASGGIGEATARLLQQQGYTVYGISRRPKGWAGLHTIAADVTDEAAMQAAVAQIHAEQGRIDLLISNAGYGISGAIEQTPEADALRQLDVNFFGFYRCAKAVLPYMRAQGFGSIVAVSSVAAVLPIPFQGFYSAGKAAVNGLALALANEVRPYGVKVCAVMPGDVRTGFTAARNKLGAVQGEYAARAERSVAGMERDEQNGMAPEYVAKRILRAARCRKPLVTVGGKYKIFVCLAKLLPARVYNYIVGKLYAA